MSATAARLAPAGFLEGVLQTALGDPALRVLGAEPVAGGCIHHCVRVRSTRGDWFAKWNDDCAPDLFLSEAEGLRALREAGAELAIPEVLVALPPGDGQPACIVMEYLPPRAEQAGDDAVLGRGLAAIHGDLWSGNVLATTRGPALVDPACAACDREMEFGITTLFGGFSERFFGAYHEALPLPAEWRERNPLYQLYHLLNHHLIFGGHYGTSALAIARRYI